MRHLNVGTQKRTKKKGAITREEMLERDENAKKLVKQHRKTERLVYVGGYFKALTGVKENETDEEAIARYQSKHRSEFPVDNESLIPLKYRK